MEQNSDKCFTIVIPPAAGEIILGEKTIESVETGDEFYDALTRKSWVVIIIALLGIAAQTFAVISTAGLTKFVSNELGNGNGDIKASWIFERPLLIPGLLISLTMQLSKIFGKEHIAVILASVSSIGALTSVRATSFNTLFYGQLATGLGLSSLPLLYEFVFEALRGCRGAFANRVTFLAVAAGTLIGNFSWLIADSYWGWRSIFLIQAANSLALAVGLWCISWSKVVSSSQTLSQKKVFSVWNIIGPLSFFASGFLLFFTLSQYCKQFTGIYDPHSRDNSKLLVIASLCFFGYCAYGTWNLGHFSNFIEINCAKSSCTEERSTTRSLRLNILKPTAEVYAIAVEGCILYCYMNRIVPAATYDLGFQTTATSVSIRQLSFTVPLFVGSVSQVFVSSPRTKLWLIASYGMTFMVTACYALLTPRMNNFQVLLNVMAGSALSIPLSTLIPTTSSLHFSALHLSAAFLSSAFSSLLVTTFTTYTLTPLWESHITSAAIKAGLLSSSVSDLLGALRTNAGFWGIEGMDEEILLIAMNAGREAHAEAYRSTWKVLAPCVLVAWVGVVWLVSGSEEGDGDEKHRGKGKEC